jgi:hypothetical protein
MASILAPFMQFDVFPSSDPGAFGPSSCSRLATAEQGQQQNKECSPRHRQDAKKSF